LNEYFAASFIFLSSFFILAFFCFSVSFSGAGFSSSSLKSSTFGFFLSSYQRRIFGSNSPSLKTKLAAPLTKAFESVLLPVPVVPTMRMTL